MATEQVSEHISEKELERRRKISQARKAYIKKKRLEGYRRYLKRKEEERLALGLPVKKKKRVGRPKKRGPKKKRKRSNKNIVKIDGRKLAGARRRCNFKIISCHNGKQDRYIGQYRTIEEAQGVLKGLLRESEQVVFPQKNTALKAIIESEHVYLLLEKNTSDADTTTLLRNKMGKYVEHKTNNDKWIIVDKAYYNLEETFWVYGMHPKDERKPYKYILNDILFSGLDSKYEFKRVIQYKNKILFKSDSSFYDIILCKNISDSIRLYNALRSDVLQSKVKNIYFLGSYDEHSEKRKQLEDELIQQTGWTKKKIQKSTT